ncbi:MAG: hypothetical protein AB1585_18500 [Thermodesulfobacteriota bacterium]
MKTWLLDADIIIDFLSLGALDKLVKGQEVYVASSVAGEITHYPIGREKYPIIFKAAYIQTDRIKEISATPDDLVGLFKKIPINLHPTIHAGESESLAVMISRPDLTFCSCDAALIRILPILDLSERGISAEKLLRESGLTISALQPRHREEYFKNNLAIGQEMKIYFF